MKRYTKHCFTCKKEIQNYYTDTYLKEDEDLIVFCNMNCYTTEEEEEDDDD